MLTTQHTAIVIGRPGELDRAITAAGLSTRALEEMTGVSRSTVSNACRGSGIAKDKAERLADAVGVPVGELFVHKDGAALAATA